MKLGVTLVCLLFVFSGCIQYTPTDTSKGPTPSPSAKDRVQQSAETPMQPTTPSAKYEVDVEALETEIHKLMNDRRRAHNVSEMESSSKLSAIGRYKSWHMAKHDYFAHENVPNESHDNFRQKLNSRCPHSGQNLFRLRHYEGAIDVQSELRDTDEIAREAVNSLMNSTGHRRNILNPVFDVQGIGVFVDENGTVFVTQEFCGY